MMYYLLGITAGLATPTQISINGKLREKTGSPYLTSIISFIGAALIMLIIVLAGFDSKHVLLRNISGAPIWIWGGGLCGVAIVMLNILCLPKLGSARTVMFLSFGQIMTSLIIDNFGIFRVPVIEITRARISGAFAVIAGVIIISYDWESLRTRKNGKNKDPEEKQNNKSPNKEQQYNIKSNLIYVIGAVLCGACTATQVAVNGTLTTLIKSGTVATLISMIVGLIVISAITLILFILKGKQGVITSDKGDFRFKMWMTTGGLFAIIIVLSNSITAPVLGAGMVTVTNLIGQMSGGLIYDAIGFLGIEKRPVKTIEVLGMIVIVSGAAVIALL